MNTRFVTTVTSVLLLSVSSGCCNLKQFWFGRGAKCGLCNKLSGPPKLTFPALPQVAAPQPYAPVMPQPYAVAPQASCPCTEHPRTYFQPEPGCGMEVAADCPRCNQYGSAYGDIVGDIGHGSSVDSYGPVVHDPYLQNDIVGSSVMPYEGQIIGSPTYNGAPVYSGQGIAPADSFDARGDRIINAEPLPPGATLLNQ